MQKGLFAAYPPFTQLILVALTMLVCAMFFMFIGILLAPLFFNISLTGVLNSDTLSQNIDLLRYLQTIQNFSLFIIPAFFVGYLFSGNAVSYFEFRHSVTGKWFVLALLVIITAIPCINLLASLNEKIVFPESLSWLESKFRTSEDAARDMIESFLKVDYIGGLLFNIFMIAILPAIGEELIFRGVVQKIFIRWTNNIHAGIIITGLLFSMMHMQFYGFFPRWLLGIMLGYMLVWSGSIWVPIFVHFIYNAFAVTASYLIQKGYMTEDVAEYGSAWEAIPVTVVTTAICAWFVWKMYQTSQRMKKTYDNPIEEIPVNH